MFFFPSTNLLKQEEDTQKLFMYISLLVVGFKVCGFGLPQLENHTQYYTTAYRDVYLYRHWAHMNRLGNHLIRPIKCLKIFN